MLRNDRAGEQTMTALGEEKERKHGCTGEDSSRVMGQFSSLSRLRLRAIGL